MAEKKKSGYNIHVDANNPFLIMRDQVLKWQGLWEEMPEETDEDREAKMIIGYELSRARSAMEHLMMVTSKGGTKLL